MSDTPYKKTLARDEFAVADSLALSSPSELRRPPAQAMSAAQDSSLAGRRQLHSRQTGGAQVWLVPGTASGGVTQTKPDPDTWRRVSHSKVEQQPGTNLVARAIAVPSGASEYFVAGGGTWEVWGVGGETRISFDWSAVGVGDTGSAVVIFTPINEVDPEGAEQVGAGAQWAQLQHFAATGIVPDEVQNLPAEQVNWSEWPTVEISIADRGGARIVHASVSESPAEHVVEDTATSVTLTGSSPQWETNRPQIEAADGGTFEEHRYGSHRAMETAARQTARVGPLVAQWTAYDERSALVTDIDPPGRTTNSATFSRISRGTNAAWDGDEVGHDIIGTQRAPEHLFTRISGASSVPVRIRVDARFGGAGAGSAVVRFASSSRGWIDLDLDQAAIGSTWTEVTASGWLEANIASDDGFAVLQDFFRTDGVAEVYVRFWSVSYGDYPTGA
jgi:hypothetical protein